MAAYTVHEIAAFMREANRIWAASYHAPDPLREGRYTLTGWQAVEKSGAPRELWTLIYYGVAIGEIADWARDMEGGGNAELQRDAAQSRGLAWRRPGNVAQGCDLGR